MKVILYMAITANGMIAKEDHDTPWTDDEWKSYSSKVKEIGNLIVGKTTYDFMEEEDDIENLGNPFVVVLTSKKLDPTDGVSFVSSFDEALTAIKEKGFETAFVGGGAQTDTTALESGQLDEIYLDVEPLIFGKGIPLFSPSEINLDLELLEVNKIGPNSVQLHYKVKK